MQSIRADIITTRAIAAGLITAVMVWLCLGLPLSAYAQPNENSPDIHWSYQETTGPDHWAELTPDFAICASGQSQSPINLTAAAAADLVNPDFRYKSVPLNVLNNGHTMQIPYAPGSYLTLDGQQYNLLQFHVHSPSEHAIEGQSWDAELHLVHQNDAGALAVVAVLLQADNTQTDNSYSVLSENLPTKPGEKIRTGKLINAQSLLPNKTTTYRYHGSLTTPPCSESVTWLIMTEPLSLSTQQIDQYKALLNHNNRPLQALNHRSIQIDMSP